MVFVDSDCRFAGSSIQCVKESFNVICESFQKELAQNMICSQIGKHVRAGLGLLNYKDLYDVYVLFCFFLKFNEAKMTMLCFRML